MCRVKSPASGDLSPPMKAVLDLNDDNFVKGLLLLWLMTYYFYFFYSPHLLAITADKDNQLFWKYSWAILHVKIIYLESQ